MTKNKYALITLICLILGSCQTKEHEFPLDKRYWDTKDYADVIRELRFGYEQDEKLPTFNDPETRVIVEKLTDEQNFKVVLDDQELGLKYKNEIAQEFFKRWRDMNKIYQATDRTDKYIYEKEMLEVWQFGLALQLDYFKLGNDQIIETADDPNSYQTKNNINTNIQTLVQNFGIYLDIIDMENALSESGKKLFAKGIDKYFTQIIELYPNVNYSGLERKAELMIKKIKSNEIKSSLNKLIELIQSKKGKK